MSQDNMEQLFRTLHDNNISLELFTECLELFNNPDKDIRICKAFTIALKKVGKMENPPMSEQIPKEFL